MIKYNFLHNTIFFVNKNLIDYVQQVNLHMISSLIMIDSNNYLPRYNIKEVAPEKCAIGPLFQ